MAEGTIKIQLVRSPVGCTDRQRKVVRGLGLIRLQQVVERPDNPCTRGMVNKIPHLVRVVEEQKS
jgi:large subunit ribosomal protein L30